MPNPIRKTVELSKEKPVSNEELENRLINQNKKSINNNVEIIETVMKFEKKSLDVILSESELISPEKVAEEVLTWLEVNVENYIDNHAKVFDIPIDNLDVQVGEDNKIDMSDTTKLQNLYRAIPDDDDFLNIDSEVDVDEQIRGYESNLSKEKMFKIDDIVSCREKLNSITQKAFYLMNQKTELKDKLAKRMMYYYEMVGFQDGKPLIQELKGIVNVLFFEYDSFSMGVRIREGAISASKDGSEACSDKKVVKEYIIPEGFSCCIEISYTPKSKPTAMF